MSFETVLLRNQEQETGQTRQRTKDCSQAHRKTKSYPPNIIFSLKNYSWLLPLKPVKLVVNEGFVSSFIIVYSL